MGSQAVLDIYVKSTSSIRLGICTELEEQTNEPIRTFFCEWTEVINDFIRRSSFPILQVPLI